MTTRSTLVTAGSRLLDYNLPPLRLWQKAKQLGIWNPSDIDFRRDRQDWPRLSELEQDALLREAALFLAGEEAVTRDLLPLLAVMSDEERLDKEMKSCTSTSSCPACSR